MPFFIGVTSADPQRDVVEKHQTDQLVGFAASIILFTVISGATGYSVAYRLVGSMHDNQVSTEALRNQMQADMMHDALRADVLAAALDSIAPGQPHKAEVLKDYTEHADIFVASLRENEKLTLDPAVAQSIAAMRGDIDACIKLSKETIDAAYQDPAQAAQHMPRFLALYGTLEEKMGKSSELIEDTVRQAKQAADDTAGVSMKAIAALSGIAVLVVLVLSTLITRSILPTLGADPAEVKLLVGAVERGELYHRASLRPGDSLSIVATLAKMIDTLGRTVGEVRQATAEVASASGDLRAIGQMDQVTQRNAALVEEAAASAESLRSQAQRLAESVDFFKLEARVSSQAAVSMGKTRGHLQLSPLWQ